MTNSIMVDIETLASTDDAAVIAIGAVIFNANSILDELQWLIDPIWAIGHRSNRTRDEFWLNRHKVSEAVYRTMFSGTLSPWAACNKFAAFVDKHQPEQAWAHPPQFDFVIMRSMFRACGNPEYPIHYRQERCCRTLFHMAKARGIDLSSAYEGRNAHSALDDARAQARAVQICNRELL